jgi:hypothetical protein
MSDRSRKSNARQPKPTPASDPVTKPGHGDAAPKPSGGGWTSHLDFQRLAAGIVLLGVSLYLLIAQTTAPAGSDTSLLSGPMGQALNIGGIVAGAWVLWTAWRR